MKKENMYLLASTAFFISALAYIYDKPFEGYMNYSIGFIITGSVSFFLFLKVRRKG